MNCNEEFDSSGDLRDFFVIPEANTDSIIDDFCFLEDEVIKKSLAENDFCFLEERKAANTESFEDDIFEDDGKVIDIEDEFCFQEEEKSWWNTIGVC